MRHRWHWTLDESNPSRVTFAAYARAIGRAEATVRKYAHGYKMMQSAGALMTADEAMERAKMSSETQAATQGDHDSVIAPSEAIGRAARAG